LYVQLYIYAQLHQNYTVHVQIDIKFKSYSGL
jgi:hypothetical protein